MTDASVPPPIPLSLQVADNHLFDARTGQHSLIGIISHIQASRFPAIISRLIVFFEITSARGNVPIDIRIVDVDERRQAVVSLSGALDSPDPLGVHQMAVGFNNLAFPEPGDYRVQLLSGGIILLERRLILVSLRQGEPGP